MLYCLGDKKKSVHAQYRLVVGSIHRCRTQGYETQGYGRITVFCDGHGSPEFSAQSTIISSTFSK